MKRNKLGKIGRRRFVKRMASLGVSAGVLNTMSQEAIAEVTDDPKREVPRLEALVHTNHEAVVAGEEKPKREPRYYTVPRDKWVDVETAHDAARRLERSLPDRITDGPVRFGVRKFETHTRSRRGVVVRLDRDGTGTDLTKAEIEEAVPATVTGTAGSGDNAETRTDIPVAVEEREIEFVENVDNGQTSKYHYDFKYSKAPAGAMITGYDEANDTEAVATACTPAYYDGDKYSGFVIVTVAHLFRENGVGNKSWQPFSSVSGSKYGNCSHSIFRFEDKNSSDRDPKADRAFDYALVQPDSGVDTSYKFASDDGDLSCCREVAGRLGWDKIKDGEYLTKQGAKTGRESGDVTTTFTNETFETAATVGGGDSGGPNYTETYYSDGTSFKAVAGVTSYGTDTGGTGVIWSGKAENEWPLSI